MGLIKTDKEIYSTIDGYKVKKGYYYYLFSHSYQGLTEKQTDKFEDFVLSKISARVQIPIDFMHYEDGNHTAITNGVKVIKYVKIGSRYIGKVIINFMMINDNLFNTNFMYLERTIIPKSTYKNRNEFRNTGYGRTKASARYRKSKYKSGNEYVSRTRKDIKVE